MSGVGCWIEYEKEDPPSSDFGAASEEEEKECGAGQLSTDLLVPEPGSATLLLLGGLLFKAVRRQRR